MFSLLKKIFGAKPKDDTQPEAAPYKVETAPAAPQVSEQATEAVVKSVAPAKKKAAPKKTAAPKKPRKTKSKPQA